MKTITEQLADALRTIDEQCQAGLNSSVYSHWSAALEDAMRVSREALAAYDAQQAHDVAAGAWSANAGSVWDHTGKWIADCNREHAARIVQCVNAHDAMVSALRGCVERLGIVIESDTDDALHGASPDDVAAYEAGRAALEAAGSPNA